MLQLRILKKFRNRNSFLEAFQLVAIECVNFVSVVWRNVVTHIFTRTGICRSAERAKENDSML